MRADGRKPEGSHNKGFMKVPAMAVLSLSQDGEPFTCEPSTATAEGRCRNEGAKPLSCLAERSLRSAKPALIGFACSKLTRYSLNAYMYVKYPLR